MTPNTSRCRHCEGEMHLHAVGSLEGEEHGLHMRIEGMPSMSCPHGHRRLVAPGFASAMLDALLTGQPLVPLDAAGRRGLLRRRYACSGCGAVLEGGPSGRIESDRVLELEGLEAFNVHVDLPTYHCGVCGRDSVEPEDALVQDLMGASVRAFRSAELAAA